MACPRGNRRPIDWIVLALGTGLFVGSIPPRLGTLGALWGIPLTLALAPLAWPIRLGILSGLLLLGVWICARCQVLLGDEDPKEVVIDEYTTMPVVFWFVPIESLTWLVLAAGFVLHRVFDITKVLGVRRLEQLPGGWGVMADDLLASLYAMGVLTALRFLALLA